MSWSIAVLILPGHASNNTVLWIRLYYRQLCLNNDSSHLKFSEHGTLPWDFIYSRSINSKMTTVKCLLDNTKDILTKNEYKTSGLKSGVNQTKFQKPKVKIKCTKINISNKFRLKFMWKKGVPLLRNRFSHGQCHLLLLLLLLGLLSILR